MKSAWTLTATVMSTALLLASPAASLAVDQGQKANQNQQKAVQQVANTQGHSLPEYDAGDRRDPFAPLIAKTGKEKKKSDSPIDHFEIMDFRVIAILQNSHGNYAVVTLPDGKSYTIREGMKLGLRSGIIHKITRDAVIVRENVKDYKGITRSKDTLLTLSGREEG